MSGSRHPSGIRAPASQSFASQNSRGANNRGAGLAPALPMLVVAAPLAIAFIARPDQLAVIGVAAVVAFLAAALGELRIVLFCFGLSVTHAAVIAGAVPVGIFIPAGIALGSAFRGATNSSGWRASLALFMAATLSTLYALAFPPATNAGVIAAYSLVALPGLILVVRRGFRPVRLCGEWLGSGIQSRSVRLRFVPAIADVRVLDREQQLGSVQSRSSRRSSAGYRSW